MHQSSNNLDPRLEALLLHKSFDALHADELQYVAQHLTEGEYRQHRQLLLHSLQLFETDVPPPLAPLSDRLKDALAQRRTPGWLERIQQLATYRIPLWQASLAMLLLAFVFFHFQDQPAASPIASTPLEQVDMKEKSSKPIPVVVEKPNLSEKEKSIPQSVSPIQKTIDSPFIAYVTSSPNDSSGFASRSFSKDRELMDLRVEMR